MAYFPSVVYSLEETETINEHISDLNDYVSETAVIWIIKGGVDEEWDKYVAQLEAMGVKDVVGAWQSAYDRYAKEVGSK